MSLALRVTRRPGAIEPDAAALAIPSGDGLLLGRGVDCGLVLADPLRLVSRQHAQVKFDGPGPGARVRCVSSSTPLWVNGVQLDPGDEREIVAGDRMRIGGFELAVEPVVADAVAQRSRLDQWFDLDSVADPLAPGSPLPPLPSATVPDPPSAVVSWQTGGHPVRTGSVAVMGRVVTTPAPAPVAPAAPPMGTSVGVSNDPGDAPVAVSSPDPTPRRLPTADSAAVSGFEEPTAFDASPEEPVAAALPGRPADAVPPVVPAPVASDLAAAFARGAGLSIKLPAPTPEWMEHLGALLRASAEGTLALLQSRAIAKRHMRAEGTHIAPRQNNPLKFSPDATEALTRMLRRDSSPGFLDPVAALNDAHRDLLVHQVAMVAGMRAAVFELFSRLGPEATELAQGPAHGIDRVPVMRAAALWERHCAQHAQLLDNLDDDFQAIFGREFLRAYEAQSRTDADVNHPLPEAPWSSTR